MTKIITILGGIGGSLAAIYLLLGSTILVVSLGIIASISIIFCAFALGSWWSARLMQSGAGIALQAQISNDKRHERLTATIGNLTKDALRIGNQNPQPQLVDQQRLTDGREDKFFIDIDGLEN